VQLEELAKVMQRKQVHMDTLSIAALPVPETQGAVQFRQEAIDRLVSATGARGAVVVLGTMIDSAPRLLDALQSALDKRDAATFRRSAHSLKANAATVGADALARTLQQLEELGIAGDLETAAQEAASAQQEYRRLIEVMKRLREHYQA